MNIFSGIVASIVVVLGEIITSGNAAKYFDAVLGVTISTTLISYLLIYPARVEAARSPPGRRAAVPHAVHDQPLTVLLMVLVAIASVQLIAPGLGDSLVQQRLRPDRLGRTASGACTC